MNNAINFENVSIGSRFDWDSDYHWDYLLRGEYHNGNAIIRDDDGGRWEIDADGFVLNRID